MDHVSTRYRLRAFEPALAAAGCSLEVEQLGRGALAQMAQCSGLGRFDVVVLQRKLPGPLPLLSLRRSARRLIYDFDDALLYCDSYHRRAVVSRRRQRRFAAVVRAADRVVAGNQFLAECAIRAGASPQRVTVIPTCVPIGRYAPVDHASGRQGLELVWIGSSSTLQGLVAQRPLWQRLAREVPGLSLRVICDSFPDLDPLPVVPVRWEERTEAAELARADVGISWMPEDLWSRGKCGLKILQYQAAGLPVVANPVGVQATMVRHGVSGFLATSADEWVAAIRELAGSAALRRRMGQAARSHIKSAYSVTAWAPTFVSIVTGAP